MYDKYSEKNNKSYVMRKITVDSCTEVLENLYGNFSWVLQRNRRTTVEPEENTQIKGQSQETLLTCYGEM